MKKSRANYMLTTLLLTIPIGILFFGCNPTSSDSPPKIVFYADSTTMSNNIPWALCLDGVVIDTLTKAVRTPLNTDLILSDTNAIIRNIDPGTHIFSSWPLTTKINDSTFLYGTLDTVTFSVKNNDVFFMRI